MDIYDLTHNIHGWLDPAETRLLYTLAGNVPNKGVIVEIGSYRGRSTVVLAMGAVTSDAKIYAIDPHDGDMAGTLVTHHDRDIMQDNLRTFGVEHRVEVITARSTEAVKKWKREIDLLWVDGSHDYADVLADLQAWSPHVRGLIAMHDTKPDGEWQGVVQALAEFVSSGEWEVIERADATSVLRRVE